MATVVDSGPLPLYTDDMDMSQEILENNPFLSYIGQRHHEPFLQIMEQPKSRGFRFRYQCEGSSHGGLQGESSTKDKKTYPAVKIMNYVGPARINVYLMTDEPSPKPHAHELLGKNCRNGTCVVDLKGDKMEATFSNLGIRHVTKKRVVDILTDRNIDAMRHAKLTKILDQNGIARSDIEAITITDEEREYAHEQADQQAKDVQLNVVKLCFQATLQDRDGNFTKTLASVMSEPIFDSKSPGAAALKICRMDKHAGCCTGTEEVFLLCDKVQKDDITVQFYEEDCDGVTKWVEYGVFGPQDVHRQYAIVFRTPPYMDIEITQPVQVQVQLKRLSDGECSDPKPFTYYPQQLDQDQIQRKRRKKIPPFLQNGDDSHMDPSNRMTSFSMNGFGSGMSFIGGQGGTSGGLQNAGTGPHQIAVLVGNQLTLMPPNIPVMTHTIGTRPMVPNMRPAPRSQAPSHPNRRPRPGQPPGNNLQPRGVGDATPRGAEPLKESQILNMQSDLPTDVAEDKVEQAHAESERPSLFGESTAEPYHAKETLLDAQPAVQLEDTVPVTVEEVNSEPVVKKTEADNETPTQPQSDPVSEPMPLIAWQLAIRTCLALQDYARTGDVAYLLLVQRYLIAEQDDQGDNALHLAVIHNQLDALRNMVRVAHTVADVLPQPPVNMTNSLNQTPLHLAVIMNQPQMVELLVSYDASLIVVDRKGNTPLHLAAQAGYLDCLNIMIKHCSKPPAPDKTKDQSAPEVDRLNFDGFASLHLAVKQGHLSCVRTLVHKGHADVDLVDGLSGRTALHHSVDTENLGILGFLLIQARAEVDMPAFDGSTALHLAASKNLLGYAALLIATGADPDAECAEVLSGDHEKETQDRDEKDVDESEGGDQVKERLVRPKESPTGLQEEGIEVGITPRDLARDNPKMLKILNGVAYSEVSDTDWSPQMITKDDPVVNFTLSSFHDSGTGEAESGTTPGDLHLVDPKTRTRLAGLLDPPSEAWQDLAQHMNFQTLIPVLQGNKSPTIALLDNYEALDGTIMQLREMLRTMKCSDALRLLEDSTLSTPMPVAPVLTSIPERPGAKDSGLCSNIESGIASLSMKSGTLPQ